MDRLYKSGNQDVRPDTITFNAVLDAWARSGDRMAAHRAEQILDHMDELYRAGNHGVKPDTYTYNTLINAHAKSSEIGSAARAEHVLQVMEQRYLDGDKDFKPNTRTHTSVIDAWAKSGETGAAKRAEQILNNMIASYEASGDVDIKPNVHTANAVCNVSAIPRTLLLNGCPKAVLTTICFQCFWLLFQIALSGLCFHKNGRGSTRGLANCLSRL
jgi:PPR repeat/Pentatricopeptide repeat domain